MSDQIVGLIFMAIIILAGTYIVVSIIKANAKIKVIQAELEIEKLREKDKKNDNGNGSENR